MRSNLAREEMSFLSFPITFATSIPFVPSVYWVLFGESIPVVFRSTATIPMCDIEIPNVIWRLFVLLLEIPCMHKRH